MQSIVRFLVCFAVVFVHETVAEQSLVKVVGSPGTFHLERNGKEYFIRGVGGSRSLDLLVRCGGNSIRTWGIEHAKTDLDNAEKHGLTVALGYWMGHERHGADYTNRQFLDRQKNEVRKMVEKFKDHPALLIWGLGNEVELQCKHESEIWKQIEELAKLVHSLDPNHPVMTVVAGIDEQKLRRMEKFCPSLDLIGVNSYGAATKVGPNWEKWKATKPYILTEFGPIGHWECQKSPCGAGIEGSSTEKAKQYALTYKKSVAEEQGKYCLGSYAFLWGDKMEGTPTWFGMLLPDGSKLAAVEAIEIGWKGKLDPTTNRVPVIQPLQLSVKDKVAEGAVFKVEASALDPDGDTLDWHWTLLAEVGYSIGGDAQDAAPEFPDSIVKGQGTPSVEVKLPGGGVYRLYAYVRDGKGNAAYASEIVQGEGKPPKLTLPKQPVPCPVYTDGHKSPWIPSGYMGEQQAIKMEADCDKSPHSGETCMRVEFAKSAGWGGVLWQNPANDWGDTPGGFDLSDATMLEIWARGEKGGEAITFQVGGLEGKPFSDSFKAQKRDIVLKKDWTRYRIALDGVDLSRVKTCFGWVLTVHGEPIVFYLDDIRFIAD